MKVDQDTLQGNWKPVIVADEVVCAEIRTLEAEIDMAAVRAGRVAERRGYDPSVVMYFTELARVAEEEDVAQFLNELGWFFQRSCFRSLNYSSPARQVSQAICPLFFLRLRYHEVNSSKVLWYPLHQDKWMVRFVLMKFLVRHVKRMKRI